MLTCSRLCSASLVAASLLVFCNVSLVTRAATSKSLFQKDEYSQHLGVVVTGHGSAAFREIFVAVLDVLGEHGVKVATARFQDNMHGVATVDLSLPAMLQKLPYTGADSLLYIKVEPGMTSKAATVVFQCLDSERRSLWEEKG
jgi:hypothetical protein